MAHFKKIDKGYYLLTRTSRDKHSLGIKDTYLIKASNTSGYLYLLGQLVTFPKELIGKRIKIKIEFERRLKLGNNKINKVRK
jgi:hypothetical protein